MTRAFAIWLLAALAVGCGKGGDQGVAEAATFETAAKTQARRKGVQQCKAYLQKANPELIPSKRPRTKEERWAVLMPIYEFLSARRSELPSDCLALIDQAAEFIDSRSE